MASQTIDIEIRAKTEQLIAEIQKAGKVSDKSAKAMAQAIVKSANDAEKAQARAANETSKHWTNATKKIGSALGEGVIPKFEKLSGVGEALGGAMGASAMQVAVLTGGLALAGFAAAKIGGAIIDTARNVDALSASLTDSDRKRLAPYIDRLHEADDALTRLDQSVVGLQIQLTSALAPALADSADGLSGLALATQDAYTWLDRDVMKEGTFARWLWDMTSTGQASSFLEKLGEFGRAYGKAQEEANSFGKTVKQFSTDQLAESLGMPSGAKASTPVTQKAAAASSGKSSPRVQAAKDETAELDALYRELAQNLAGYEADKVVAAQKAEADAMAERQRRGQEQIDLAVKIAEEEQALRDAAAEDAKRKAAEIASAHQTIAGNVGSFVGGLGDLVSTLYEQAADGAEKGSARERKARRAAFATAKAAALVQAGINTALGVTSALSLPVPYNYINAAIVGALGAVEIGTIAAKQMPVAHVGRMIGAAPDEQAIMALRGEAVLSRQAVADLGGEQAVSNANRRTGPVGGGQVGMFAMTYEHRSYDAFVRRDLQRPTGVLRHAIRTSGSAGLISRG